MLDDLKNRKETEEKMKKEGRLPPGQSLTNKFPVLHYGPIPPFKPDSWTLRVWGEVEEEVSWDWDEFNKLPRAGLEMDIHCVTRWSKFDTKWEGVSLNTLIQDGEGRSAGLEDRHYLHIEFRHTNTEITHTINALPTN